MAKVIADSRARDIEPQAKRQLLEMSQVFRRGILGEVVRGQLRAFQAHLRAVDDEVVERQLGRFRCQQIAITVCGQAELEERTASALNRLDAGGAALSKRGGEAERSGRNRSATGKKLATIGGRSHGGLPASWRESRTKDADILARRQARCN